MKNTAFSLMTALLAVMNESEPKDPYCVLAQYFLYHFDQLRDLNIYDVADACYVSRSGIRRFCQSIGFDNFSDMKAEADEWQRQCNYFIGYSVRPNYKEHLSRSIEEMMAEINRYATPAVMDRLAESIHASRHVVLFTSDFSGMAARSFQQSMVVMGKLVQIVSDAHYMLEYLEELTPDDLLITVSATGNFATLMQPVTRKIKAYRVLVTVNHEKRLWTDYDQVIYLSEKDNSNARTVYSQYGMTYFFDILYSHYVQKYRERDLLQGPISEPPLSDSQKMRVQRCAE